MSFSWLDWDGRTLRWQCAGPSPMTELRIDGVVFDRVASSDGIVATSFDYSPSGDSRIEFSLTSTDGEVLLPRWRVVHGTQARLGRDEWQAPAPRMRAIANRIVSPASARKLVSIVIPIFNAPALVERCIESVIRWTSAPARLILIDDASDDRSITAILQKYTSRQNITISRNAKNLGYTQTSNLGIQASGDADVVLLNSDTEVGPRWLDRLCEIAYSETSIGTVTAVSDNAGAFSVPDLERYCPIPAVWTLPQTQRAMLQQVACPSPELPTGNGFCMFIKRAMLDAVGVLDADAFPFGYGEENDLCQRAELAGFRHLIAGDVFVAHARSASFGDERRARLGEQGMAVLRRRYPDYERKVGATLYSFTRRVLDYRVRRIYGESDRAPIPKPRLLVIARSVNEATNIATSHAADFDSFIAINADPLHISRVADGDMQNVFDIADDESLRIWLIEHVVEYIALASTTAAKNRWRRISAELGIALIESDIGANDLRATARHAWIAVSAFGQSRDESDPNSCL